jgi:glucose/arabinose dehydrogenase
VLLDLPALSIATNHNGGALQFGSDGKLYVGVGDNANSALAPDLSQPFGKLLRIEPSDGSAPADNPFVGGFEDPRVWAYGLRNPFSLAVQAGSARIHINDVGDSAWEEINLGAAGADYGWPDSEGPVGVAADATAPLFAYPHTTLSPAGSGPGGFFTGQSIAGGAFYPGSGAFPAPYRGNYFFADFVERFVAVLDLANGNAAYAFARLDDAPVDLRVGADGALYVLTRSGITRISAP